MTITTDKAQRTEQRLRRFRKITIIIVGAIASILLVYGAIYYYYPYGKGVKSGQLNYVVHKGVVFKTYEGRLIQAGLRSQEGGGLQSNEFVFSVADKGLAERLMSAGGQTVELHYTEYFGALPWRGYSRYIVDSIVSMSGSSETPQTPRGIQL